MSVSGPGSSIQDFTPVGAQQAQIPQLSNDQILSGVQSSDASQRDQAELALAAKWNNDPRGALDILRQLPVERQHALATTIGDRQGDIRGDRMCTPEDVALTKNVLQALGLPDQLSPAPIPKLNNAEIERDLKSTNPAKRQAAELALAAKYREKPDEALAIIKKLPTQQALGCATAIADQQGFLRGDLMCRPEDNKIRDAVLNKLADDADFAGKWAGELAKGMVPGGKAGVDVTPPGTVGARDAVMNLLDRQVASDGAPKVPGMASLVKGMYQAGGDAALTNTLKDLSNQGPVPRSLAFLKNLDGPGTKDYLARLVTGKPTEAQTMLENFLQGMGKTDPDTFNDTAEQLLSSFEDGLGNNSAAKKKFGEFVQTAFENWGESGKIREISRNRVKEQSESVTQTTTLKKAEEEMNSISKEFESASRIANRTERIQKLRELEARTNTFKATLGAELKASGGIDIKIFSASLETTIKAEVSAEHARHSETETETSMAASREVEETRRQLENMTKQVTTRREIEESRSKQITKVIDTDGDATAQVTAVRNSLKIHGAKNPK